MKHWPSFVRPVHLDKKNWCLNFPSLSKCKTCCCWSLIQYTEECIQPCGVGLHLFLFYVMFILKLLLIKQDMIVKYFFINQTQLQIHESLAYKLIAHSTNYFGFETFAIQIQMFVYNNFLFIFIWFFITY